MSTILFYSTKDPYGEFSNFSAHAFTLKDREWPTTEHYFQAQKFAGTEHEELIRQEPSPMVAARMGRSRKRPLRQDWEVVKDEVMMDALRPNSPSIHNSANCSFRPRMRNSSSIPRMTAIGLTAAMELDGIDLGNF